MNSTEACSPAAPERPSCKCSFAFTAFAYPLGLPPNPSQWVRVDHGAPRYPWASATMYGAHLCICSAVAFPATNQLLTSEWI
jgi:hypothetical protein